MISKQHKYRDGKRMLSTREDEDDLSVQVLTISPIIHKTIYHYFIVPKHPLGFYFPNEHIKKGMIQGMLYISMRTIVTKCH